MTNRQILAFLAICQPGTRLKISVPKEQALGLFEMLAGFEPASPANYLQYGRCDRPRLAETSCRVYVNILRKKEKPSGT